MMAAASPIIFLLLIGVNPVSVFVPVGSILLAASFVFAPTVQSFMTCLVFVLLQHPYDVGDVVCGKPAAVLPRQAFSCPHPCAPRHCQIVVDGKAYRGESISLIHASLITTDSKARHYYPHVVLAKKLIENDARSPHARAVVRLVAGAGVEQMQASAASNCGRCCYCASCMCTWTLVSQLSKSKICTSG